MLSNSSKYAIKAVLYLALYSSETSKIMVKDISTSIEVPQAYLAKLLQELSRHNIISSTKGPKGGFYLNEKNRDGSLINIVHVIDGQKRITSCLLGIKDCDEERPCPLHNLVAPSRSAFLKSLENKTIGNLSIDIQKQASFLPF
ncbi:MAG: Rrf2 family transcriptional regulator [Saonia sp.]